MPTQRMVVRVPFTDNQNDARIFCSHGSQLRPTLSGWHGKPPEEGDETTLFLEGKNFSIHDTHVIAGGKPATAVLVSRQLLEVTIPKDACPTPSARRNLAARHQCRDAQRRIESPADQDAASSDARRKQHHDEKTEAAAAECQPRCIEACRRRQPRRQRAVGQPRRHPAAGPASDRRVRRRAQASPSLPHHDRQSAVRVEPLLRTSRRRRVTFAALSIAFLAQSSQQTVISLSPTLTLIPPSVISQSHTGHFFVFMRVTPLDRLECDEPPRRSRSILVKTS